MRRVKEIKGAKTQQSGGRAGDLPRHGERARGGQPGMRARHGGGRRRHRQRRREDGPRRRFGEDRDCHAAECAGMGEPGDDDHRPRGHRPRFAARRQDDPWPYLAGGLERAGRERGPPGADRDPCAPRHRRADSVGREAARRDCLSGEAVVRRPQPLRPGRLHARRRRSERPRAV